MKLVGKAIKSIVKGSELTQYIGTNFFNALAPQSADYPFAVGRVTAVVPVDYKANPNFGRACTDTYYYRVTVYDKDAENAALIASKVRKVLDRPRPGPYAGMQLNFCRFTGAEEDSMIGDDVEIYAWNLDFEIRMDFSTDDI